MNIFIALLILTIVIGIAEIIYIADTLNDLFQVHYHD